MKVSTGFSAERVLAVFGGILAIALVLGLPTAARAAHPTLPECERNDPDLLLPDLVPETPTQIRNTYRTGGRVIAFTTAIGNIGDGPLLLEGRTISTPGGLKTEAYQVIRKRDGSECARIAGQFIFHPAHFHWHFERFVGYELREGDANGRLVAGGQKTTFCLLDIGMVRGYGPVAFPQQTVGNNCGPEGRQGISVGWKDIYLHNYADQYVQLDRDVPYGPVPPGGYALINNVDPDGILWETTRDNNIAVAGVGVTEQPPDGYQPPPTPTPRAPKPPNIRPPRERPTRPPRPGFTPRERPTREPRATRPPKGPQARTPTPRPGQTPGGGNNGGGGSCQTSCTYSLSQVRMTWYDATGLNLSALVGPATCAALTPEEGEAVNVHMYDWLRWDKTDTGIDVDASFTLGSGGGGGQSSQGSVNFSRLGEQVRMGINLSLEAAARGDDGNDFPVVFQTCVTVGDQQVPIRLVCQPKATGMLCHL